MNYFYIPTTILSFFFYAFTLRSLKDIDTFPASKNICNIYSKNDTIVYF